ncbi:MAG: hypothetical protein COB67_02535 [SAR324 cluster bacterium]|uniref:Uncharacterized protein n=1 Tax=SAR324 cluster bacterium TaxID=2024889 RepID=A0A2A4T9G8_9DELT|nr:MAG: hypothetical protein COB67_02535 [SAR324 cluster bacterium]
MDKMIIIANSLYSPLSDDINEQIYKAGFIGNDHKASASMSDALKNRAKILSLDQNSFEPKRWHVVGMEYSEESYSCACGKPNLKKLYKVMNEDTSYIMTIGSSCLKKYFELQPNEDLMSYISSSSTAEVNNSLKKKYDALILSCIGFRNLIAYTKLRSNKEDTPKDLDRVIKEKLSQGLHLFDSVKWEKKLSRAKKLYDYLLSAPQRKSIEENKIKFLKQMELNEIHRAQEGISYDNRPSLNTPRKQTYIKIDPTTLEEFDEFGSHVPKVMKGSTHDVDVIDGKWFCQCEDCGSMIYTKDDFENILMKCDACENVIMLQMDEPF